MKYNLASQKNKKRKRKVLSILIWDNLQDLLPSEKRYKKEGTAHYDSYWGKVEDSYKCACI